MSYANSLEYHLNNWRWYTVCEYVDEICIIEDAWLEYIEKREDPRLNLRVKS